MTRCVKYLVSLCCKILVKEELKKLELHFTSVELGFVEIMEDIINEKRTKLKTALSESVLKLMKKNKNCHH